MSGPADLARARSVADAVLFEGYLLYPYRATSSKNQARWQFGVLGPPGAAGAGIGEDSTMSVDCLLDAGTASGSLTIHVRFLQLQKRTAEVAAGDSFGAVDELVVGERRWLTWDEAVEVEQVLGPLRLTDLRTPTTLAVNVPDAHDVEIIHSPESHGPADAADAGSPAGRLLRERCVLTAELALQTSEVDRLVRLSIAMSNTAPAQGDQGGAIAMSFIGTHLILQVEGAEFVSTVNPPEHAVRAAAGCRQRRWWPVLAGPAGQSQILLVTPIIVEDYAELAPESAGALFDSTEIDEILTLGS